VTANSNKSTDSSSQNCCSKPSVPATSCCDTDNQRIDWLLWSSACLVTAGYLLHLFLAEYMEVQWLSTTSTAIFQLINTMWWSMLLAAIFVGVLGRIPQEFVISILGRGGTWSGLIRATFAGLLMDLCSHGILMVGMQLYRRGASLGQVMAFLIASPWNSLSLTIILVSLVGLSWTLLFVLLSLVIALISGRLFDMLGERGVLPIRSENQAISADFQFWPAATQQLKQIDFSLNF